MKKICVTPRSLSKDGHPYLKKIGEAGYNIIFPAPGKQPTEAELLSAIPDCEGWIAGVEPISDAVLAAAKKLKAISRNGTGVDNIDLAAAAQLGITVLRAEGANSRGAAELAFGQILAGIRRVPRADNSLKRREWKRELGTELFQKTLGIVGFGKVGSLVARFALAFGMRVLAHDRSPGKKEKPAGDFAFVGLDELIEKSDVITLHIPAVKGGHLIDRAAIGRMKRGVVVVNTARASLLDEAAAREALDSGRISCLTLDAFGKEPPDDWDLVTHPNVIATPHIGAYTVESVERATIAAVDNLLAALAKG